MFFFLSKTVGWLTLPTNLAIVLLGLALTTRLLRRGPRLRRWCVRLAIILLATFSPPLTSQLLLGPLENAYPRPQNAPKEVRAIAMLGGVTQQATGAPYELNSAADRFVEALRLAHRYPQAKLMLLGGNGSLIGGYAEAEVLASLAVELGISRSRMLIDKTSRNTRENALNATALLRDARLGRGELLLVTSAFHMPRSMACFRKAYSGRLKLVAWPADRLSTPIRANSFIPRIHGLERSEFAIKELVGYLVYMLLGYV